MDRRTLIAITLGILFFIGWQKFYIEPKYGKKPGETAAVTQTAPTASISGTGQQAVQAVTPSAPKDVKSYSLTTGSGTAMIGDGGKFFTNWIVEGYHESKDKNSEPVALKNVLATPAGQGELAFDLPEYAYLNNVGGKVTQSGDIITWTYEDANVKLMRKFARVPGEKYLNMTLSGEFKTKKPSYLFVSLGSHSPEKDHEEQDRQLLHYVGGDAKELNRLHVKDIDPVVNFGGPVDWMGTQSRYFLMAMVPGVTAPRALGQGLAEHSGKLSLVYPLDSMQFEIPFKVYFGPKEMSALKSVAPSLDLTIDLGFFTLFAYWILKFMKWIHTFASNWGVAIILLTVAIKILTFPLTYKSMKSMKRMAALQPQLNALKEKYANDKEALNREMITFMRTQGYNPISGCLPILVQMPVFFALWRVLYSSIELYQAPFFGWIQDLSVKDPYYVTPVILTAVMYFQQKLTPSTATDPMQAKMLQWMPVIFGVMMLNLPAGLTLYMLTNAVVSIIQQVILNRKLGHITAGPVVLPAAR